MDLGVRDKGYLVVGGTSGMGLSTAEQLAAEGARVVVVGRDEARAQAAEKRLRDAYGADVYAVPGDVSQPGAAEVIVAEAIERLGTIRGLAVTTGTDFDEYHPLLETTPENWEVTFRGVLMGTVWSVQALVPHLVDNGGGTIVTTAAYSIRSPKDHLLPYSTLKGSVSVFTKSIAKSLGPQGIRANCVCPGAIETEPMAAMRLAVAAERGWPVEETIERLMVDEWHMDVGLRRPGRTVEAGELFAFLLSERAAYLTGAVVNIDGGTDF
jgi:NAD(P)-dependent dehydrogenase (short-subunit alcohol dehydrogenase family)